MKMIRNTLSSVVVVCALISLSGVAQTLAADASGTWTWTTPARGDLPERKSTLELKQQGNKLAGKLSTPGRDGNARVSEIEKGMVKDGEVSFTITREFNDRKFVMAYKGKVSGDELKGTISFQGRDGESRSRDWVAKRAPAKK